MAKCVAIIALLGLLIVPTPARAWVTVVGDCSSTGPIAGMLEINAIILAIEQVGQALDESLQQNAAAAEKQNEFLANTVRDVIVKQNVARDTLELDQRYGEESSVRASCQEDTVAIQKSQASETRAKLRQELRKHGEAHSKSFNRGTDATTKALRIKEDKVDFNPEGDYLSDEDLQELTKAINYMVDPVPSLQFTDAQLSTPLGIQYRASEKKRALYLKEARNVFNDREALLATKITDPKAIEAIKTLYTSYGNGDTPPQVQNNEISVRGLWDFYIHLRFNSPNWMKDVKTKNDMFQQREQTIMMSMLVKLMWESLKQQQAQSLLLAQIQTDAISKEKAAMNSHYSSLINAQR